MDHKDTSAKRLASNIPYVRSQDAESDFCKSKRCYAFQHKTNFIGILFSIVLIACFVMTIIYVTIQSDQYFNIHSYPQAAISTEETLAPTKASDDVEIDNPLMERMTFYRKIKSLDVPMLSGRAREFRFKRQTSENARDCRSRQKECQIVFSNIQQYSEAMQERMNQMHTQMIQEGLLQETDPREKFFHKIYECMQCRNAINHQAEEDNEVDAPIKPISRQPRLTDMMTFIDNRPGDKDNSEANEEDDDKDDDDNNAAGKNASGKDELERRQNLAELSTDRAPLLTTSSNKQVLESVVSNNTKKINDTTRVTVILRNVTIIEKDEEPAVQNRDLHPIDNPSAGDYNSYPGSQTFPPLSTNNYYKKPPVDQILFDGIDKDQTKPPVNQNNQATTASYNPSHGGAQHEIEVGGGGGGGSQVAHEDVVPALVTPIADTAQTTAPNQLTPQSNWPYVPVCFYGLPPSSASNSYQTFKPVPAASAGGAAGLPFYVPFGQGAPQSQPMKVVSPYGQPHLVYTNVPPTVPPKFGPSGSSPAVPSSQARPPLRPQHPQNPFGLQPNPQQPQFPPFFNQRPGYFPQQGYQPLQQKDNFNNYPIYCYPSSNLRQFAQPNQENIYFPDSTGGNKPIEGTSFRDGEQAISFDHEGLKTYYEPEDFDDKKEEQMIEECPGFWCPPPYKKCIKSSQRCDGRVNCIGAEDEIDCSYMTDNYYWQLRNHPLEESSESVDGRLKNGTHSAESDEDSRNPMRNHTQVEDYKRPARPRPKPRPRPTKTPVMSLPTTPATERTTQAPTIQPTVTEPTTTAETIMPTVPLPSMPPQFICSRLIQSIPLEKRCDNVYDCEDASDEKDCKCKDYLKGELISKICDGHVDCYDGSDEEGCDFCGAKEFYCHKSGTCIKKRKRCNLIKDCKFNEDESDCFVLTDGENVNLDLDDRPHLNVEGVLTNYDKGGWRATCLKPDTRNDSKRLVVGQTICDKLGFKSVESMEDIVVRTSKLNERSATKGSLVNYEYPPHYTPLKADSGDKTCYGAYIRCKPILNGDVNEHLRVDQKTRDRNYMWPWEASIFVDGKYRCSALLLENNLLLATSKCADYVNLRTNYSTALVGAPSTNFPFNGPYQQISPIVDIKPLKNSDASVFRLKNNINMTRYVQPIYLEKSIFPPAKDDVCIAIGVNEHNERKIKFLQTVDECPKCHRCYIEKSPSSCSTGNGTSTWSGNIACLSRGGWYPAAVFHDKDENCGFQKKQILNSIDYIHAYLSQAIGETVEPLEELPCNGIRCSLGQCIPWDRVCNGVRDCQDGIDEKPEYCKNVKDKCDVDDLECKCKKTELRCGDGKCIPKEMFCDGKQDCADGSDETDHCTCADYLSLTEPKRVCDGRRHCLDKSDENYEHCSCKDSSFRCDRSPYNGTVACIPQDFVCDGYKDCPQGEDELNEVCWRMEPQTNDPKLGEVMRRTFGVLQSECFPRPIKTNAEATKMCNKLGYISGMPVENTVILEKYYEPRNDFFMVQINNYTWVTMRPDVSFGLWKKPETNCYRVFVHCF